MPKADNVVSAVAPSSILESLAADRRCPVRGHSWSTRELPRGSQSIVLLQTSPTSPAIIRPYPLRVPNGSQSPLAPSR